MEKHFKMFRVTSILLLVVFLNSIFLPFPASGQETGCPFDPDNPSLDNARKKFLALNYKCAEEEINAVLAVEGLTTEHKADAHVLLAEVYYAKVRNNSEKRTKVITQFVAAFDAYRDWKGELNIKSPEFMSMMKEAQTMVDQKLAEEKDEKPAAVETAEKPAEDKAAEKVTPPTFEGAQKAWYKNWWAIALGVGVVAGGVVMLTGGGDDGPGPPDETLPDFPDPPSTGKRK